MATRLFGTSQGESGGNAVTEAVGSAVASDSVEVTVDLAAGLSRHEVLLALERIAEYIQKSNWPPA